MFKSFTNTNYPTQNLSNLGTDTTYFVVTSSLLMYLDAGNRASYPGSGSVWTDLSGNGKNGNVVFSGRLGGEYRSTDGGLLFFNNVGIDSGGPRVYCGNLGSGSSTFSSGFTVDVWFNVTCTNDSYSYPCDGNISKGNFPHATGPRLEINDFNNTEWVYGNTGTDFYKHVATPSTAGAFTMLGRWNCCCITYDVASNTSVTYYNGSPTNRSRSVGGGSPTGWTGSMTEFTFAAGIGGNGRGYCGVIGAGLVYTRALTAAEVNQNFWAQAFRYNSCCNGVPNLPER